MALSPPNKMKLLKVVTWGSSSLALIGVMMLGLVVGVGASFLQSRSHRPPGDEAQESAERQAITQELKKLPVLHKYADSYRLQADGANAIPAAALPPGMDVPALMKQADTLTAAFTAEAQKTGILIMHARQLPDEELSEMSDKLRREIGGNPNYVMTPQSLGTDQLRACQETIMSTPGFTPTLGSAQRIETCVEQAGHRELIAGGGIGAGLGIWFIGGTLLRRRLKKSIDRDDVAAASAPPPPAPDMPITSAADITVKKPLKLTSKR